jgi:hypothetical protein
VAGANVDEGVVWIRSRSTGIVTTIGLAGYPELDPDQWDAIQGPDDHSPRAVKTAVRAAVKEQERAVEQGTDGQPTP